MHRLNAPPVFKTGGAFSFRSTLSFLILLIIYSLLFFPPPACARTEKSNVLLITVDTLRPDRLSCYSQQHLTTPNIDRLAEKGVVFTRAFAHTPMTLPSHANIFLGATPLYHGVHDNSHFIVQEEFMTLAEWLKNDGYATGAFVGAFPLDSRFGLTQGFDVYDDNYGYENDREFDYIERRAEVVIANALQWIRSQSEPWFCWIHCFDPHQRYDPPETFKKSTVHPYDGEVAYVDYSLGKLFDFLEEKDTLDQTMVIFTGDHGESLGEHGEPTHGYFAYNSTLWIPLIFSYPGAKAGRVEQNVCHSDIFPTICDVLRIEKPSFLQGVSLLPAIKGKKIPERAIYFEALFANLNRGWAPLRGLIEGQKKYLDSPLPELYDMVKNFGETQNLALTEDLGLYKKKLDDLTTELSIAEGKKGSSKVDMEALKKLESLGYLSSIQTAVKKNFKPEDDLKTLLPYQVNFQKSIQAYNEGRFAEGIALLKDIIADRKDFDQAYSHLATLYKEQNRPKEALATLKEGLEHNPSNYKIIKAYGILLIEIGQYDAAIGIIQQGLALIDYDPNLWNYLGVAYWSQKDFENAAWAYQKALSLDDNFPVIFNNLGSLYLSLATESKKIDDLQKAIHNFKKAIELDPGYASAYNGLGTAYGKAGDLEAAISCWQKAVEIKPDFAYPLYNLGLTHLAQGQEDLALTYFEEYKQIFYSRLSAGERQKLDSLIVQCRQK